MHRGVQWPSPTLKWPGGELVCVTFRVAYEAFRKSGRFKKSNSIPVNLASLSHANYGGAVGIWRLREIFQRNKIKAVIGPNGLTVEKWPESIKALFEDGHEICCHGMTNDHHMTDLTPEQQLKEVRQCVEVIKNCTGQRPYGWAGPGNLHTEETLGILAGEGFTWFGDVFDDDVPYVAEVEGKRICCIPKLNYANDWRAWSGGAGTAENYFNSFKESFDYIYEEALRGRPGLVDVIVHAELSGRPNFAMAYERMMRYVHQFGDAIWQPTRREMADYLLKTYKKAEAYRPLD